MRINRCKRQQYRHLLRSNSSRVRVQSITQFVQEKGLPVLDRRVANRPKKHFPGNAKPPLIEGLAYVLRLAPVTVRFHMCISFCVAVN